MRFAHGRAGVVRATIRAEAVASVKERLLCGPLSHDNQGKAKSSDGVRIFLVRDDEQRWSVCVAPKLRKHGSNSHLAPGPALAARQNIRRPAVSWCAGCTKTERKDLLASASAMERPLYSCLRRVSLQCLPAQH